MFAVTRAFPTRLHNVGLMHMDKFTLLLLLSAIIIINVVGIAFMQGI
jgi:hypothetical protein